MKLISPILEPILTDCSANCVVSASLALSAIETFYKQGIFYARRSKENMEKNRILGEVIASVNKINKVRYNIVLLLPCYLL